MDTVQNTGPRVLLDPLARPASFATACGHSEKLATPQSAFARAMRGLVGRALPRKIVETGTSTGLGSTLLLCEALRDNELSAANFYSIEVNPSAYLQACENLAARGHQLHLLRGLSLPRALLPTEADIRRDTVEQLTDKAIFVDYPAEMRVQGYSREIDFPDALDDLLGYVLRAFNGTPDLVLLDSAGHLGFIEFQYALSLIHSRCYIALDDVYHIKHHRSLQLIQADSRFQLLELSRENFGFCIAQFDPA